MTCAVRKLKCKTRMRMEKKEHMGGRERSIEFPKKKLFFTLTTHKTDQVALLNSSSALFLSLFSRSRAFVFIEENFKNASVDTVCKSSRERVVREKKIIIKNYFGLLLFGIKLFVQRAPIDSHKTIAVA